MKMILVLALLLGFVPLSAWADGGNSAQPGPVAVAQTDAAGATRTAKSPKKHPKKKVKTQTLALAVTEDGFVPADLPFKKGEPIRLVVTRRTDQTCATQIVLPDYGLTKDLPLNVPVTLSFTPKSSGDIHYSCGMGMLHGVLSAE